METYVGTFSVNMTNSLGKVSLLSPGFQQHCVICCFPVEYNKPNLLPIIVAKVTASRAPAFGLSVHIKIHVTRI
jgi:hypothetical protein